MTVSASNINIVLFFLAVFAASKLYSIARMRVMTSRLPGPPSASIFLGASPIIYERGTAVTFEEWGGLYGQVFEVPLALGSREIVIMDPKAIAHVLSKDAHGYVHPPDMKRSIASFVSL